MPFRNHGFTRQTSRKKNVSPVVKAAARIAEAAKPKGAAPVHKQRQTEKDLRIYRDPPTWWFGPLTEWVVWDDLTTNRKLIPQVDQETGRYSDPYDFAYQAAVTTAVEQRGFFRADFVFPPGSRAFLLGPDFPGGLVLDPYSDETHPVQGADIVKRAGLSDTGKPALTIFLEQAQLLADPHWLVGEALRGVDHSDRGAIRA